MQHMGNAVAERLPKVAAMSSASVARVLCGLVLCVWITGLADVSIAQASPMNQSGSLDMDAYCVSIGALHSFVGMSGDIDSWRCATTPYGGGRPIDVQQACERQYGSGYKAVYSDRNDAYSWYCSRTASPPGRNDAGVLGGLDLDGYCAALRRGYAVALNQGDAYSWRCADSASDRVYDMDLDGACRLQYGQGARSRIRNSNDIYSWYCER